MADETKPSVEPVVPDQLSADDAEPSVRRDADAEPEAIPDAEVIEDRRDDLAPPPPPPAAEARPEPTPQPEPQPEPPRARSGGFLGFLLGGAIAAGGGFALARYVPEGWPTGGPSDFSTQIEAQAATIAELKAQIEALAARETPDPGVALDALRSEIETRLSALPAPPDPSAIAAEAKAAADAAVADLSSRLAALEKRPAGTAGGTGVSDDALAAFDQELQALKSAVESRSVDESGASEELRALAAETEAQLAAAAAEAENLRAEAEAAGRAAQARAALARIQAALDAGGPYSSAVADLTETGNEVPPVLADSAAVGVPTLLDLQRNFAPAARAALDAALNANMGESWTERVATYLRSQTGARSLVPQDGNDPDAVLSRAEAAVGAGDLTTALTEVLALPEAAQPALADWIAAAEQRQAATAAVAALSTALDAE